MEGVESGLTTNKLKQGLQSSQSAPKKPETRNQVFTLWGRKTKSQRIRLLPKAGQTQAVGLQQSSKATPPWGRDRSSHT